MQQIQVPYPLSIINGLLLVDSRLAALQCSVDNLPSPFRDTTDKRPDNDRFQAIVPAYEFQCSGRVTEWGACVQPGGSSSWLYYIQFQVWRPTDPSGCYSLVGFNRPVDSVGGDGVLSPLGDNSDPLSRCVVLPVTEDQQIEVPSGDVVGYYVDHFRLDNTGELEDRDFGGIQWIEGGNDVVVNPRRACAARVTVVVLAGACLSVCLSVCYHVFFLCTHLSGQVATRTASE